MEYIDLDDDDDALDYDPEAPPVDQVRLTSVGIDIGSATTHFLLSRITLRRLGVALMSRFEVVSKEELYRSDILFTPYRSSTEIDADQLREFFTDHFARSGVTYDELDTGVVMLTGEAARKSNARAIATLFAESMGKFVCTSAGHHLEARMAASGSGALVASREAGTSVVNVDMGGGTTKFTVLHSGEIAGTAALNVGGRLVALEDDRVVRIDDAARRAAERAGVELELGAPLSDEARATLCATLAAAVVDYLTGDPSGYDEFTQELLLTDPLGDLSAYPDIVMSGGVSEYLNATDVVVKDLGPTLARAFAEQAEAKGLRVRPASERMRATVVGLSQFTTQLSGDTVYISSERATPRLNLPVVEASIADLGEDVTAEAVTEAIRKGLVAGGREGLLDPVAVSLEWNGRPYVKTLTAIAQGVVAAAYHHLPPGDIVLVLSQDCARSLGRALRVEVGEDREFLCIDELHLRSNDFIDVGAPIQNGRVLPVVVKTLVFPDVSDHRPGDGPLDEGPGSTGHYVEVGGQIL